MVRKEWERYERQVKIPEVGEAGQQALQEARVLVVGTGGLGSPILMYLAAAGVGSITVVDDDVVDISNLNRQVIHGVGSLGKRKVASAASYLENLNPDINYRFHDARFDEDNAFEIAAGHDYVIDASDNFETKFLVNDASVRLGIPCTVGGVVRWDGQMLSVLPGQSACYRCVFAAPPPSGTMKSPAELGIIGVSAGIMGIISAGECIKYFLGFDRASRLVDQMMVVDLRTWDFTRVAVKRNDNCPTCGLAHAPNGNEE